MQANMEWERIMILVAAKEQHGALDWAATGRKGQVKSPVPTNMDGLGYYPF
jgi:hypothetical protein